MFAWEDMSWEVWLLCSVLETWFTSQLRIWLIACQSEESPRRQSSPIQWIVILMHPRNEDNKGDQPWSLPLESLQSNQLGTWRKAQWMNSWAGSAPLSTEETVDLFLTSRALVNFIKSYRSLRQSESCEVLMVHYLTSVPMETTNTTLRQIQGDCF